MLVPHGFSFTEGRTADGPLGSHASGAYSREDRRIELHFRRILGSVVYHVGDLSLSHEAYMRAVLGLDGSNEFPHFTGDPLDGFRHLAHDLSTYCGAFLKGPPAHFREIVRRAGEQAQLRLYRSELEH